MKKLPFSRHVHLCLRGSSVGVERWWACGLGGWGGEREKVSEGKVETSTVARRRRLHSVAVVSARTQAYQSMHGLAADGMSSMGMHVCANER